MKKRNRVLEAILCAALAVVVFWGLYACGEG